MLTTFTTSTRLPRVKESSCLDHSPNLVRKSNILAFNVDFKQVFAYLSNINMKRLFWIDLEMTGLDETVDTIVEVAIVITDLNFNPLEEYHRVIFQPEECLSRMGDYVRKLHTSSGLIDKIPHGIPLETAETEILDLMNRHFEGRDRVPLVGNSVGNDKRFIDKYLPEVAKRLHYRIIDISSFKEIFRSKYNLSFQKKNLHRAVSDIHESIEELKFYLSFVQVPTSTDQSR
jgi:oligoribonuclease